MLFRSQYLDDLHEALLRCARQGCRERRTAWLNWQQRLFRARPSAAVSQRRELLRELARRLRENGRHALKERRNPLANLEARLRLLSPDNVLARGYSITTDAVGGQIIRAAAEVRPGQKLRTKLQSGEVRSVVED